MVNSRFWSLVVLFLFFVAGGLPAVGIDLTFVPPCGSSLDLEGEVVGLDPADYPQYRIISALFVTGAGWYSKPTNLAPCTDIQNDGRFTIDMTTGGQDALASVYFVALVPVGSCPPLLLAGESCIPGSLLAFPHVQVARDPSDCHRAFDWQGHTWWVKNSTGAVGPGPNVFSDSVENVWVDGQEQLHLKITNRNGSWQSAEIVSSEALGYGIYSFRVRSIDPNLDPRAVLGLFLWDETDCAFNHREIDIEISHWLDPLAENYQFVVQPYGTPGNRYRFVVADPSEPVTSRFLWDPQRIEFQSVGANTLAWLRKEDVVADWSYAGNDNPPAGNETVRLNLWLIGGQPPEYLEEIEFVVESFSFRSLYEIEGDINRDGRVDLFDVAELANRWLADCNGVLSPSCRPTTLK